MKIIIRWLLTALAIFLLANYLPGVHVASFKASLVTALVLGLINTFIKPIIKLLTLPLNIITLGLFGLVINVALILIAAQIVPGFSIDSFLWALIFGVILALIHWLIKRID